MYFLSSLFKIYNIIKPILFILQQCSGTRLKVNKKWDWSLVCQVEWSTEELIVKGGGVAGWVGLEGFMVGWGSSFGVE